MKVYPVVIAGGRGERFWPKSRRKRPKQFLRLFGRNSLIADTQRRISRIAPPSYHRYVIPEEMAPLLFKELRIHRSSILVEPEGKNTFPAISFAAACLPGDGIMVVLPSDHLIQKEEEFYAAVRFACELAEEGYLVTFGIEPNRVETGYGYIETKGLIREKGDIIALSGVRFTEKPDYETAKRYCEDKNFLWNSGIFVWSVSSYLAEVATHFPDFFAALREFQGSIGTKEEKMRLRNLYEKTESISVDYAIMEKAKKIAVVKGNFLWDDVGGWLALERHFPKDGAGNIRIGNTFLCDTKDSVIYTEECPVFAFGVSGIIIVRTHDLLFICPKEKAGKIKEFLNFLASEPKARRFL